MKNFYDISIVQLLTIWVFGLIATLVFFTRAGYPNATTADNLLAVVIPFFLFFYSFGWKRYLKKFKERN